MQKAPRQLHRLRTLLAVALTGTALLPFQGCFDSELAKRFREAWGPGFIEGLSSALTDPANAEAGLRAAGAAFLSGLGAMIQPREGRDAPWQSTPEPRFGD